MLGFVVDFVGMERFVERRIHDTYARNLTHAIKLKHPFGWSSGQHRDISRRSAKGKLPTVKAATNMGKSKGPNQPFLNPSPFQCSDGWVSRQ